MLDNCFLFHELANSVHVFLCVWGYICGIYISCIHLCEVYFLSSGSVTSKLCRLCVHDIVHVFLYIHNTTLSLIWQAKTPLCRPLIISWNILHVIYSHNGILTLWQKPWWHYTSNSSKPNWAVFAIISFIQIHSVGDLRSKHALVISPSHFLANNCDA